MNYQRVIVYSFLAVSLLWGGQVWGATGDPLWTDTFNYLPNYDNTQPVIFGASSSTLIVCGTASKQQSGSAYRYSIGFIRAYDIGTGSSLWQGTPLTLASTNNATNFNQFHTIIFDGNIAMVQGIAWTMNSLGTMTLAKTIIRAYNARSGQLIWENISDGVANSNGSNALTSSNLFISIGTDTLNTPPINGLVEVRRIPITGIQGLPLLLN